MQIQKRDFLRKMGSLTIGATAIPLFNSSLINSVKAAVNKVKDVPPNLLAQDEDFWYSIQQAYTCSPTVINLNNGGVSPQPLAVQDAQGHYIRMANEGPAYYMWRVLGKGRESVRRKLADLAGCDPEEIAINRNTTEALETIIFGLDFKKGDEVLITSQDYNSMRNAFYQKEKREGIVIKEIKIPVPAQSLDEIVAIYEKAITPKTKLVLVTHMINLTGQILPVKKICEVAHKKGVEVMVDAAHTFAHIDFKISDFNCDYLGTSLHKWLCAPFGTGMMYIKKEKIKKVWPLFADDEFAEDNIRKFEHIGTHSFPSELAIGQAINFHNGIGTKRKEERLRYLKNYWVKQIIDLSGMKLNTSLDSNQSCGLANFSIAEKDPDDIVRYLFKEYNIFVNSIKHEEALGVRVTPHIYTTLKDLDLLVDGIKEFCKI